MEVRPIMGQEVSVATIELSDDIKLFDFCKNNGIYEKNTPLHSVGLLLSESSIYGIHIPVSEQFRIFKC